MSRSIIALPNRTRPTATTKSMAPKPVPPLTLSQVKRWRTELDAHGIDAVYDVQRHRVDPRFRGLSPVFTGLLEDAVDWLSSPNATIAYLQRAVDSWKRFNTHQLTTHDRAQSSIVADWALRYALPIWLEVLLPEARETANRLRGAKSPMWSLHIVEAITALLTFTTGLSPAGNTERGRLVRAHVQRVVLLLTHTLDSWVAEFGGGVDNQGRRWDAKRAMDLIHDEFLTIAEADVEADAIIASQRVRDGFEVLFEALVAVGTNDSQIDIARRCVWPKPVTAASARAKGCR